MTDQQRAIDDLRQRRPDWTPWLAVVDEIVAESGADAWEAAVPENVQFRPPEPILAGATISLPVAAVSSLMKRLLRTAARSGSAKMASLESMAKPEPDALKLFEAAIRQDARYIEETATAAGADAEAFHAVVMLAPVPLLQACRARWASLLAGDWDEGYCPICGSWPAFVEVRGIERTRCCRCGRCGAAWHTPGLRCLYCGNADHADLATFVNDRAGAQPVADVCRRCLGYMKTLTRLLGCPPASVMLDDLATIEIDIAAVNEGYSRPAGAGRALEMTVIEQRPRRRFAWST